MLPSALPRRQFSLDALIAEAKRRARRRRVLLAAVLVVLAAGGTTLALRPFGLFRTSRSHAGLFEPGGMALGPGLPSPYFAVAASLRAVSAASRSDAWIVGSVVWRWDGTAWRSVPLPMKDLDLSSVVAVARNEAWAVGWRGTGPFVQSRALIEHWNGARWSVV